MVVTHITIQPPTLVWSIGPFGFHRYGREFFEAAVALKKGRSFSPVRYYLYCHAIELLLKAFLLTEGMTVATLRNKPYSHDLERILKKARSSGLHKIVTITPARETEIKRANSYYNSKGFEYFKVGPMAEGYLSLPDLSVLRRFASRLVEVLEPICLHY